MGISDVSATRRRFRPVRLALLAAGALFVGLLASPVSAPAQNFFDLLFGGFRRAVTPPPPPTHADPASAYPGYDHPDGSRGEGGPSVAFCVRTCDGRFFPIRTASPAEICNAFCPASPTRIFSGSKIDYAVGYDGRSYREMPNAFLFREKLVEGCTCNGRDPFGLARIDVRDDPTLRPGDIVATSAGLMQATGRRQGELMPISGEMRRRLSEVKVWSTQGHDSEAGDIIPGYDDPPARAAQAPLPPQRQGQGQGAAQGQSPRPQLPR